jgi:hypothetical protein
MKWTRQTGRFIKLLGWKIYPGKIRLSEKCLLAAYAHSFVPACREDAQFVKLVGEVGEQPATALPYAIRPPCKWRDQGDVAKERPPLRVALGQGVVSP